MVSTTEREAAAAEIEAEMAEVCGVLNAATGRLVGLVARAIDTGACEGWGIRSPEQWVGWKCGLSPGRSRRVVAMARRLPDLPVTRAALEAGELSEDQVSLVCRHAPARHDAEVADFARLATVGQLARVLRRYVFGPAPDERKEPEPEPEPEEEEPRRVSFGTTDEGAWRLSALLPPDEGALVEMALAANRQWLADQGHLERPTWADALVAMAERSLGTEATARPHRDRHMLLVHLRADHEGHAAHLHLGPGLPDALRRHLGCDGRVRAQLEARGVALSVGRALRIVPERTRVAVEERDGACRVPGCERTRWLQVHHILHWEDGGATDTANLVALCARHHRMHHLGQLGITGNGDDPGGMVFTDVRGRRLHDTGRPAPPGQLRISGRWAHPLGERLDSRWVHFNEVPARC